ncbi:DUF29 domain-containing protein [Acidisoma sp.]|uniref:DUF29 domain-containing protein n=1 Tax=Acidisoma sp. TaxID=1872115 RepID=UPI003B0022EC
MPDNLYDTDILIWSEHQADLLRRFAHGERLNDTIDWENVIEEVQSVGRSELNGCESLLRQALIHLLKLHLAPRSRSVSHWRGEVATFIADARHRFSPSMRQRIDLAGLYAEALSRLRAEARGKHDPRLPAVCPFGLDDLLVAEPEIEALLAKVGAAND